ncbi:MAG TPA: hypothetical protein VF586_11230 [Pyrinomonadaceae bacterium]|jgi:hypothetical protein
MKSKATHLLRVLLGLTTALALTALTAMAQQPSPSPQPKDAAAKTQSPAPKADGDEAGDYTVTSSIELGYRGLRVGGDLDKYQSDLNYKTGPRLFDTSLLMRAKEGRGPLFDTLLVTSTGWGGDPQGGVRFSLEKSSFYRFDGNYRKFTYFRALNNFANPFYVAPSLPSDPKRGWHSTNTDQQVGDFDLTLLPKNERVSFRLGYSPTRYSGPAFTSWHYGGDDFVVLSNNKSRSHEFRVGADWKLGPVVFSLLQGFRRFRDESTLDNNSLNLGANPTTATSALLYSLNREAPIKGTTNYTQFTGHTLLARKLDLTGRFVYSASKTEFDWKESATGANFNTRITNIPGAINPPNILTLGRWNFTGGANRPAVRGDFGATLLFTSKFRISNTFSFDRFNTSGSDFYAGVFSMTRTNGTGAVTLLPTGTSYELSKFRKIADTVEGDYRFNDRYSLHLGYRYGTTRVEEFGGGANLGNNGAVPLAPSSALEENHTHAFIGGLKARPVKSWTLFANVERGVADGVLTRVGQYDYTNFRVRSRYTPNRRLALNLSLVTRDNSNPSSVEGVSLEDFGVSVKSRVFASSVDYTPDSRLSVSGGYNYQWVNSDAVVRYTYAAPPAAAPANGFYTGHALYYVRLNYFHLDVTAQPFRRVTFFASYRINRDEGQGGRVSNMPGGLFVSSYPMSYQSPEGRLSLRLNRRLDANFGYQYYNYNESEFRQIGYAVPPQNYHAHIPYASLRFYFGNAER